MDEDTAADNALKQVWRAGTLQLHVCEEIYGDAAERFHGPLAEPVNGAAVDEGGKHTQTLAESIANGAIRGRQELASVRSKVEQRFQVRQFKIKQKQFMHLKHSTRCR